jgi:hypothetical protein
MSKERNVLEGEIAPEEARHLLYFNGFNSARSIENAEEM